MDTVLAACVVAIGVLLLGMGWLAWRWQQASAQYIRLQAQWEAKLVELENLQQALDIKQDEWHQSQLQYQQLKEKFDRQSALLQERQLQHGQQLQWLQEQKQQMKQEFELLASQIIERKGQQLTELQQQSLQHLLQPLRADVAGFRQTVETMHSRDLTQRGELKAELQQLQRLNVAITDQAARLTQALQGQKKVQGNWGELMLENVLENSGLRLGQDYRREVSLLGEDGRRRPDAIIYLPQHKHLVIDAKTSLTAYTRYINSQDDAERQVAIAQHCQAVCDRIYELADKNYFQLSGIDSPEVVFMFIPVESAYSEALRYQPELYQIALERNILITTPTTLLTSLTIVRQLWRYERQHQHSAELALRAERFYQKLLSFLDSMQGVGRQLDRAKESYDKALAQLYLGKANLIKQASEFKDLGVMVRQEIDTELLEKAALELPESTSNSA